VRPDFEVFAFPPALPGLLRQQQGEALEAAAMVGGGAGDKQSSSGAKDGERLSGHALESPRPARPPKGRDRSKGKDVLAAG
jgi:hypothetical protein